MKMSTNNTSSPLNWKSPNEILKLQRLQQKKKQLAARLNQTDNNKNTTSSNLGIKITAAERERLLEAKISQKRRNPFVKSSAENSKRCKTDEPPQLEQDDSIFGFLNTPTSTVTAEASKTSEHIVKETPTRPPPAKLNLQPFDANSFSKLLQQSRSATVAEDDDGAVEDQQHTKHLPMDWSIKTRARFFCRTELPVTTLKTSQMASGLTSFVRCIDAQNSESGFDISPATRFNASTYYWQHPHIPWLTLFPRNSKNNTGLTVGERERQALLEDWDNSFRGLFQLLRARQCPYFYVLANTFSVLFRAAGTAGCDEMHALMSPTTRGLRSALRQEGIEYTMPLKKESNLNKSSETTAEERTILEEKSNSVEGTEHIEHDEEVEEEEWLESLGVDEKEIRRIRTTHTRQMHAKEMSDDFSDHSSLLIEGVECQGFFSFLLNAKSTISTSGRLAGVPPTLLSPVGFPKATLQQLTTRSNTVRMDGVDYFSIEVKGIVLPTFLPYTCNLLGETKETFSVTLATSSSTMAFSKATQCIVEQPASNNEEVNSEQATNKNDTMGRGVFGQENLSDCGLQPRLIESICRTGPNAVSILERVCYDKAHGYAWS